jgi:asparagine synthase (glutamine-hydrolysing)
MCGICGVLRLQGPAEGDADIVGGMVRSLRHRGPDGEGMWHDDRAAFGHTRLAIIDLACGYQPIFNETGEVALFFNGEIYNYRELRPLLERAGHHFQANSDTEVLVHGYEEWGDALVQRLRGMFAFAVWDARRGRMLLARDRLGEKPLYYHLDRARTRLLFASEIKALFADPGVPRALNAPRLPEYLTFRGISGDETLFEGIRQLEPGTTMVLEGGRVRQERSWSAEVPLGGDPGEADAERRGGELLADAIRARLVSDVALGALTSGGLDSSLVTAIATQAKGGPMDTFVAGFREAAYDERPYARRVADLVSSRHHEIVASAADIERELDRLTWASDEPLTHPNSIPMHLVFRHAKEEAGVTVVLSGEGADEVFGGYAWYASALKRDRALRVPGAGLLARLAPLGRRAAVLRKVLHPDYLLRANAYAPKGDVDAIAPRGADALDPRRGLWPAGMPGPDGLFVYDQRTYLLPLLQRQDRMSMAAGVEARVVFLDHALVEWANALPAGRKLAGGARKALLKSIARSWLPDDIIFREKVGFAMPLGAWMRRGGPLAQRVEAIRERDSFVRGLVDERAVERLIAEHDGGAADHTDILWTLASLEVWGRCFLGAAVHSHELPGAVRPVGR